MFRSQRLNQGHRKRAYIETVLVRWSAVQIRDVEYVYSPLPRGLTIPRGGTYLIYSTFLFYGLLFSGGFSRACAFSCGVKDTVRHNVVAEEYGFHIIIIMLLIFRRLVPEDGF